MKTIHLVLGTRPEAIKMAPLYQTLLRTGQYNLRLVSTGQHRELLMSAMQSFQLKATFSLNAMKEGQSLPQLMSTLVERLDQVFRIDRPDLVLGHGDTGTTMATALTSFYMGIPFYHVEAGLRSHDLTSPFPEEFHRQSVAKISAHHFVTSIRAQTELLREGIAPEKITLSGNTLVDALAITLQKIRQKPENFRLPFLGLPQNQSRPIVTLTLHRREGNDSSRRKLFAAYSQLAQQNPSVLFVTTLHPSPSVQVDAKASLLPRENLRVLKSTSYERFLDLLCHSSLVLTDSAGVQEECAALGIKTFILRERTERLDGVGSTAQLLGRSPEVMISSANAFLKRAPAALSVLLPQIGSRLSPSQIIAQKIETLLGASAPTLSRTA